MCGESTSTRDAAEASVSSTWGRGGARLQEEFSRSFATTVLMESVAACRTSFKGNSRILREEDLLTPTVD